MILLSKEYKQKLKDYMDGRLNDSERVEIEKELSKLEIYQELLNENFDADNIDFEGNYSVKEQSRILRKGKWKARFHNAFIALSIIIILTIVSSVISTLFYSTGKPNKMQTNRDVVRYTIAVTRPNITLGSNSMHINAFFSVNFKGDLEKRVGGECIRVGQLDAQFFFNNLKYDAVKLYSNRALTFIHPNSENQYTDNSGWKRLDMLHEGTVAEACISFDKLYETDEILQKFKNKDIMLLWFAVDTGVNSEIDFHNVIGFPDRVMWHYDDQIFEEREVKNGRVVSESWSYPKIEVYGSGKIRNENFMKTLRFINDNRSIAKKIDPFTINTLDEKIKYLEENGIKIYGMVVTGGSKEILKLREEEWVKGISIGEVRLWNLR